MPIPQQTPMPNRNIFQQMHPNISPTGNNHDISFTPPVDPSIFQALMGLFGIGKPTQQVQPNQQNASLMGKF